MPENLGWVLELHEEQRPTLYRLALLLGAGDDAGDIVRSATMALHRRGRRLVDPMERIEFLQEQVVHLARSLNRPVAVTVPEDDDCADLMRSLAKLPRPMAELLVVSHFLGTFGPELASVMRMTVRGTNQRLEHSLNELRGLVQADVSVEALSEDLAAGLRTAARPIRVPDDEGLIGALRERVNVPSRGYLRGQLVVVSAIVALALGAATAAFTRGEPDLPSSPPTTPTGPTTDATAPVAMRAVVKQVPVFYVGRGDSRLYRELRNLPAMSSLARSGVEALLTLAPLDPDYTSLWDGSIREVQLSGDELTVNLSADAFEAIDPVAVEPAINQIVYTTSEALGNRDLRVKFLSDGAAPPEPFDNAQGFGRTGLQPMPGLWISSPGNQAQLSAGEVIVTGTAKPDFGAPVVSISNVETQEQLAYTVAQTTLTANSDGWLVWSMSATLPRPGAYEIVASSTSTLDGQTDSSSEDKTINIG